MRQILLFSAGCVSNATLTIIDDQTPIDSSAKDSSIPDDTGDGEPCLFDGDWHLSAIDCEDSGLLDITAGPIVNCRLPIVTTRYDKRVSTFPPLCEISEELRIDASEAPLYTASSHEQLESLLGCYETHIDPLPLGEISVTGPTIDSLSLLFSSVPPWTLMACGAVRLDFER